MKTAKNTLKIGKSRKKHKNEGHRKRLRQRFLQFGLDSFLDYEIVELLLTLGTPLKDCKQMAKEAIQRFQGLRGVLDAPPQDLQQIKGIGQGNFFGLKLFQAVSERYAKERILEKITLDSPAAVADYLQKLIGHEKKEHFVILCLDTRNNLIKASHVSTGSLDMNIVHPREVFKEAIQSSAAKVIVAHNHPGGSVDPSEEDIAVTVDLIATGKTVGIEVLDHIIVTGLGFLSFKEKGLLF